MTTKNEIILLKLGGSLLTDKNKPFSLREDVLESCLNQIIESQKSIILIHGGGSFGHPVARKYQISQGLNNLIKDQIMGLSKTHDVMNKFNSIIINKLLDNGYPAISIQPSSIFVQEFNQLIIKTTDPIEKLLELGIMPVLYGDILLSWDSSFTILSGDQIILKLCECIEKFQISKVIFAMETDGIYIIDKEKDENKPILATDLYSNQLESLHFANLGQKIDVTGGIEGKINSIKQICDRNIPVQLINGLKNNYIYKSLKNQKINCTNILIES